MRERTTLPFLVLDLGLNIIDGVGRLNLEGDGLASEGLYEDLHVDWKVVVRLKEKGIVKQEGSRACLYMLQRSLNVNCLNESRTRDSLDKACARSSGRFQNLLFRESTEYINIIRQTKGVL